MSSPTPYRHHGASTRPRCPVCHTSVFSASGIHPQCAVKQSDETQRAELKAAARAAEADPPTS